LTFLCNLEAAWIRQIAPAYRGSARGWRRHVFSDIGVSSAEEMLAKAQLTATITGARVGAHVSSGSALHDRKQLNPRE
jgi:hypothetical protein